MELQSSHPHLREKEEAKETKKKNHVHISLTIPIWELAGKYNTVLYCNNCCLGGKKVGGGKFSI